MAPWTESHSHINFNVNLSRVSYSTWMLLGAAESKVRHIASAPLLPEVSEVLHSTALIRGAQATTAIEGNTLSEDDVRAIAERRSKLPESRKYQEREVQNVLDQMNALQDNGTSNELTVDDILNFNRGLLDGLELEKGVFAGELRAGNVIVGPYRAPDYQHVPELLSQYTEWLRSFDARIADSKNATAMAILKTLLSHLLFVWIHPFGDGNGRTARHLDFKFLLAAGVPVPAAHLLSHHFNRTRDRYYVELNRARTERNPFIFVDYAVQGFVDCLQEQIETVQGQQFAVMWTHIVRNRIPSKAPSDLRKQELAIALGAVDSLPKAKVKGASPELAELYAGKTSKTVSRDVNALVKSGLVLEGADRTLQANRALVFSLVPHTLP